MSDIVRVVDLPATTAELWAAVTDSEQLSAWFGAEVRLDLRPGGRATFRWPDGTERGAVVESCEVERTLVLRWLPFESTPAGRTRPRPATLVRFVIEPGPSGSRLTVIETAPDLSTTGGQGVIFHSERGSPRAEGAHLHSERDLARVGDRAGVRAGAGRPR